MILGRVLLLISIIGIKTGEEELTNRIDVIVRVKRCFIQHTAKRWGCLRWECELDMWDGYGEGESV